MRVRDKLLRRVCAAALLLGPSVVLTAAPAFGQAPPTATILADGSVGGTFAAFDSDPFVTIDSSSAAGVESGTNAFFSWSTFNVASGQSVMFTSANPITSFISRVTGGSASTISGALGTDVAGANIWLINPNGVIFGAGSTVFGDGGLYVATSDQIQFANDEFYSVQDLAGSTLSTAAPQTFGFVNGNVGDITFQGAALDFSGNPEAAFAAHDISVVGDGVFSSNLTSSGTGSLTFSAVGDVAGSVDAPTTIAPAGVNSGLGGNFDVVGSTVSTSNPNISGGFFVNAGPTNFDAASFTTGGAQLATFTVGDLSLTNNSSLQFITDDDTFSSLGLPGFLRLDVFGDLFLDGSSIFTGALAAGDGGALFVNVDGDVTLNNQSAIATNSGVNSGSVSDPGQALGAGGALQLGAFGAINVLDGSSISTQAFGAGAGGDVSIAAGAGIQVGSDPLSSIRSTTFGDGAGGDLTLSSSVITVSDGALISTETTGGSGDGGDLEIALNGSTGSLLVRGLGSEIAVSAGVPGTPGPGAGTGESGDMRITDGGSLSVLDGGSISSGGDFERDGGDILIENFDLVTVSSTLAEPSSIGMSTTDGAAGVLRTRNVGLLTVGEGGEFGQELQGSGVLGGLDIELGTLLVQNGGRVGVFANGSGSIADSVFNILDSVLVSGVSASGAASEFGAEGKGGDYGAFTINAGDVVLSDGGLILARAFGDTVGGAFTLNADTLAVSNGARLGANAFDAGELSAFTVTVDGAASFNGGDFLSLAALNGVIGDVNLSAGSLSVTDGVLSVRAQDQGGAGLFSVVADTVILESASAINATAVASGSVEGLAVNAGGLAVEGGSTVGVVAADSGAVGDVSIAVAGALNLDNGVVGAETNDVASVGDVTVNAGTTALTNASQLGGTAVASSSIGDLALNLASLSMDGTSTIGGSAFGASSLGSITIDVAGAAVLDGGSLAGSITEGSSTRGLLRFSAGSLSVLDGSNLAAINRSSAAQTGFVVKVDDAILIDGAESAILSGAESTGAGAALSITAADISVLNSGVMESFVDFGASGAGGSLTLNVTGLLLIENGSVVAVSGGGSGALGDLLVNGGAIRVGAESFLGSRIGGAGAAGLVDLSGSSLTISGDGASVGQLSSKTSSGDLDRVLIAVDDLVVSNGGAIQSDALGAGTASDIVIKALNVLIDGGSIDTTIGEDSGDASASIAGLGGSSVGRASGPANSDPFGDITIIADALTLDNGGTINTATLGGGAAGDILIVVNGVTLGADSLIGSQAGQGSDQNSGAIVIVASTLDFDGGSISTVGDGDGGTGGLDLIVSQPFDFDADFGATNGDGSKGLVTIGGAFDVDQAIADACSGGACASFNPFRSSGAPTGLGVSQPTPTDDISDVADVVAQNSAPTSVNATVDATIDVIEERDDEESESEADSDDSETSYVGVDLTMSADRRESHDGFCEAAARGDANSLVESRADRTIFDPTAVAPAMHATEPGKAGAC